MEQEFDLKPADRTAGEIVHERLMGFATEYVALCKKYNFTISACGCCNSPFLVEIDRSKEFAAIEQNGLIIMHSVEYEDIIGKVEAFLKKLNI